MKLIAFPTKKKEKSQQVSKPILGDICFNWQDVEIVECSKDGNTIIHFYSGRTFNSRRPFAEGREAFLNARKAKDAKKR